MSTDLLARLGGWPRRLLALACLLLAAGSALATTRATARPVAGSSVLVAARPLAAGAVLVAGDVRVVGWPNAVRPPNALSSVAEALGRRVAGPVGAQEPLTATRLVGAGLATGLARGLSAVTVAITGPGAGTLIRVGDRVDLLVGPATDPGATPGPAAAARGELVATGVQVLATIPPADDPAEAAIVVAVDQPTVLRIAALTGRPILAAIRDGP